MDEYEWVEIVEPETHKVVYANPKTGVMRFTPPEGVPFKPMSNNQWWELFDANSNTYYYHNPHNGNTIWERPESADIISLTSMQNNANNVIETIVSNESTDSVGDIPTQKHNNINPDTGIIDGEQEQSTEHNNSTIVENYQITSIDDVEDTPLKDNRKNSDAFNNPLDTLSPLCLEYEGRRFSSFTDSIPRPKEDKPASLLNPIPEPEPDIKLIEETPDIKENTLKLIEETPDIKENTLKSNSSYSKIRPLSDETALITEGERKRLESFLVISIKDGQPVALPGSPRRAKSEKTKVKNSITPGSTNTLDSSLTGKSKNKPHNRSLSQGIPPAPLPPLLPAPTGMSRSMSLQVPPGKSLEQFGQFSTHKSGLFRKKVTIANMLAFTKDPIRQPMILQRDKDLKKESIALFKLALEYMGDRKSKAKGSDQLALHIVCKCWEKKGLRDELYVQLCRQTTSNPKKESLKRGWQLFTICLSIFPPSIKFQGYLEGYLWRNVEPSPMNRGVPVETYAKFCHKRVEKITRSGAKKGLMKPTLEEIQQAKNAPFNPSPFGSLLEEVMELQKKHHSDFSLPWVMIELCDAVLRLRGPYTQGIFRIPGDIDAVNALKLFIDKDKPVPDSFDDPHVPASLLKLWFRELEDPLIPENYYQSCIANFNNPGNAVSLIHSLPKLNKEVLLYIVNFLQQFITTESSEHTKMGVDNIAMVWAPNFLRCPSIDHVLIFENTRKEMAFVRILLTYLNRPDE